LVVDGRGYSIRDYHTNDGHVRIRTLPDGKRIDYDRDALGRSKGVASGFENIASDIEYHSSGAVSSLEYGNGFLLTQTLNDRLLPERMKSLRGSIAAFDSQYDYNKRGQIAQITNQVVPSDNRSYSYDKLGQLVAAQGSWGAGSYKYDSTGNLLEKVLGDRTVSLNYNAQNQLESYAELTDAQSNASTCSETRDIHFDKGLGSTVWTHRIEYDRCKNSITSIETDAFHANFDPVQDEFSFNSMAAGQTQVVTGDIRYLETDENVSVEVRASLSTDEKLKIEHRVKPDSAPDWTIWVDHGTEDLADAPTMTEFDYDARGNVTQITKDSANCVVQKNNDFSNGIGKTVWTHIAKLNRCEQTVSVLAYATNIGLIPSKQAFEITDLPLGTSRMVIETGRFASNNQNYAVQFNVTSSTSGRVYIKHRARNASTNSAWSRWVYQGMIDFSQETGSDTINFDYDMSDQPVSVSGKANATYSYDGNKKRVKSKLDGKTTHYMYDQSGTLMFSKNITDRKSTQYIPGAGMTLARIDSTGSSHDLTYLHNDHLGSLSSGTNRFGQISWQERYTPFGEALTPNGVNDNKGGFTGHVKDTATGLNYMQARYYDPNIGRFLSIDPVTFMDSGNPGSFNRYAYTFNDPVNKTDPTGEFCVPCVFAVIYVADKAYGAYDGYQTAKAECRKRDARNETRAEW